MKRLLVLLVILLFAFYVAWPGWSAYQIDTAIKAKDAGTLAHKIDFPSVRVSLRPAFTQKLSEIYDRQLQQTGATGALIGGQLKQEVLPGMIDVLLVALVTPENLIRLAHERGRLKDSVDRLLGEEMGRSGKLPGSGGTGQTGGGGLQLPGGLGDLAGKFGIGPGTPSGGQSQEPASEPKATATPATGPGFGLDSIKHFSILGPLAFEIGVAKDKAAAEPDVTAEMRFTDMDWKITAIRPRL